MDSIGQVMGFDFGLRRIGVATAHTDTGLASPLLTLQAYDGEPNWNELKALVDQWRPKRLIIGVPLHMDGSETSTTKPAEAFGLRLFEKTQIEVSHADERYSSREAEALLLQNRQLGQRRRSQKGDIDQIAAALILQNWLDNRDKASS